MVQADSDIYDLVIVGSGSGALVAALVAADGGQRAIVLEKEALFGGSSARSGGAVWIPMNAHMARKGVQDSEEAALTYIRSCTKGYSAAATEERMQAYVRTGPEMLSYLERAGLQVIYAHGYSDYYDERPGGQPMGRAIEAKMLDARELGTWGSKVNRYALFAMPVYLQEFPALSNAGTTLRGKLAGLRLAWRMLKQKMRGAAILAQGSALQGRMLKLVLDRGVEVCLDTPVTDLLVENGMVTGVVAMRGGERTEIRGRAVLLGSGGFSANLDMRKKYLPSPQPTAEHYLGNPGDTGEMLQSAMALGAAVDQLDESWWVPGGTIPGGFAVSHTIDLSKPHCIMVDAKGQRFLDEAQPYMEIGQTMFAHNKDAASVPSWAVFDAVHRAHYTWGMALPGKTPPEWLESGYLKKADTLEELADICGIDRAGLLATVARFNGFARSGKDEDFARGARAYDRMNGDPSHRPNPSLGTIEKGPFYAAQIHVGDVGTCGGLVTDPDGRVLREDSAPIPGLYAFGNVAANCFGRAYPGPGITLGQSMIFGYRAARHALRLNSGGQPA